MPLEKDIGMISLTFCLASLLLASNVAAAPAASVSGASVSVLPSEIVSAPTSPSASEIVSVSASPSASEVVSEPVPSGSSPVPTGTWTAPPEQETVPPASNDPNPILWLPDSPETNFEPIRNDHLGAKLLGPHNIDIERENADLLIPPSTDSGSVPGSKWPFALSHNRVHTGGWARQENVNVMPVAKEMASVNMRLIPGAVRELHWHKTAEWAYILEGRVQVTAVNADGQNYIDTVGPGDLWYFPPGIPHSLQATDDNPDGSEFILVFDNGAFSEDSTFMLTDWLAHVPKEVLANNFAVPSSAFDHIPERALYIFPAGNLPEDDSKAPQSPQGTVPEPYTYELSKQEWTQVPGGRVKVIDSTVFKVSTTIAAAEVEVEPGAIRELHWHPTEDEWSFFIEGYARVTIFASGENSRTFNYQAGDIGYVPASQGHYVQNVGNTTLRFLEIFNSPRFQDISLNQWLALTPPELVKAHLDLSDDVIAKLTKTKVVVQAPS